MRLEGKRVLVTGANGVLGRAVTVAARDLGADVIAADLTFEGTNDDVARVVMDLADPVATARVFADLDDFDVLFNLVGGFAMGTTGYAVVDDEWKAMFRINADTVRNAIRGAVPMMLRQGHGAIVNVGAMSAREGQAHMSAYCAAKSTVMRLTESLAKELRSHGINVNAVLPSILDTPRNRHDMPDADYAKWVQPADLAQVICFLGSDAARAIHGALIPVVGLS